MGLCIMSLYKALFSIFIENKENLQVKMRSKCEFNIEGSSLTLNCNCHKFERKNCCFFFTSDQQSRVYYFLLKFSFFVHTRELARLSPTSLIFLLRLIVTSHCDNVATKEITVSTIYWEKAYNFTNIEQTFFNLINIQHLVENTYNTSGEIAQRQSGRFVILVPLPGPSSNSTSGIF